MKQNFNAAPRIHLGFFRRAFPAPAQSSRAQVILLLTFIVYACVVASASAETVAETLSSQLSAQLGAPTQKYASSAILRDIYATHGDAPIWHQATGEILPAASTLLTILHNVAEDGLVAGDYHLVELEDNLSQMDVDSPLDPILQARQDLLYTDALLLLAKHLRDGRVNAIDLAPVRRLNASNLTWAQQLIANVDQLDVALPRLRPALPLYGDLQQLLVAFARLEAEGGSPVIPGGLAIKRPTEDARLPLIAQRLQQLGFLHTPWNGVAYDEFIEAAVRNFQSRYGLAVDGEIGSKTLAALNVSAADRLRQIEANLERLRWLPEKMGQRYILINSANFQLDAVADAQTVLTMKVVVGRAYRRTPVFSDSIRYAVFNPSWDVPPTILREDVLPALRRDVQYLTKKHLDVLTFTDNRWSPIPAEQVDWPTVLAQRHFPYRFRQPPGPENPLGKVKFMFPNIFDVYLHDTPQKELFKSTNRDFSSGCIRVENARALAEFLFAGSENEKSERLDALFANTTTQVITLPAPVPIHIQYWTIWRDAEGQMQFRADIYGRDTELADALALRQ